MQHNMPHCRHITRAYRQGQVDIWPARPASLVDRPGDRQMARMNPRRRRLAAQAKVLQSIVAEHGPAHDDSYMLQQGRVKSSYERLAAQSPQNVRNIAYRANARPDGFAPSW